jgi:hypothetical protein
MEAFSALSPDTQPFDKRSVSRGILRMQIIQEPAAFPDQAQESATRMMIFRVGLQMLGQLLNTRAEERHLDFRRSAVGGSACVGLDNFPLANGCEGHQESLISLFLLVKRAPYQRKSAQ